MHEVVGLPAATRWVEVIHRVMCVTRESDHRKVIVQHQHLLDIFSESVCICMYCVMNSAVNACLVTGKTRALFQCEKSRALKKCILHINNITDVKYLFRISRRQCCRRLIQARVLHSFVVYKLADIWCVSECMRVVSTLLKYTHKENEGDMLLDLKK